MELEWEDEYDSAINKEVEVEEDNGNQSAENPPQPQIDIPEIDAEVTPKEGRVRQPPVWAADYTSGEGLSDAEYEVNLAKMDIIDNLAFMVISDPTSYQEAVKHLKWRQAMDAEIESIERNETWALTLLPAGAKTIGVKWIYKTKLNELGEVDKFKADRKSVV